MASKTHKPPITPMSTHEKMLHRASPSLAFDAEPVELKKSWIHFAWALECLVADTIIQAAATENPANIARPCSVTYRLYKIVFICRRNTVNCRSNKADRTYLGNTNKSKGLQSGDNKADDSQHPGCKWGRRRPDNLKDVLSTYSLRYLKF